MTPEDLKEVTDLIASTQENFKTDFTTELTSLVNKSNQGLAASLTKQIDKAVSTVKPEVKEEGEDTKTSLTMKALQSQIAELTKGIEDERNASFAAASDAALTNAIATSGTNNPSVLKKLLSIEYQGQIKQDGGNWFLEQGEKVTPLSESVKTYLATPDGQFFVSPSGVTGSGSTETSTQPPEPPTEKKGLEGMLSDLKSGKATLAT